MQERLLPLLRNDALRIATGRRKFHDVPLLPFHEKKWEQQNGAPKTSESSIGEKCQKAHADRPGAAAGSPLVYVCRDSALFTASAMLQLRPLERHFEEKEKSTRPAETTPHVRALASARSRPLGRCFSRSSVRSNRRGILLRRELRLTGSGPGPGSLDFPQARGRRQCRGVRGSRVTGAGPSGPSTCGCCVCASNSSVHINHLVTVLKCRLRFSGSTVGPKSPRFSISQGYRCCSFTDHPVSTTELRGARLNHSSAEDNSHWQDLFPIMQKILDKALRSQSVS